MRVPRGEGCHAGAPIGRIATECAAACQRGTRAAGSPPEEEREGELEVREDVLVEEDEARRRARPHEGDNDGPDHV